MTSISPCTIHLDGPSPLCLDSRSFTNRKEFGERAFQTIKTQTRLGEQDAKVVSVFLALDHNKYDVLQYEKISDSNTYTVSIKGDDRKLKQSFPSLTVENTEQKVKKTLYPIRQDPMYNFYSSYFESKEKIFSDTSARTSEDPMLKAFFNTESLEKVTVTATWNDSRPLVTYTKEDDSTCCIS